MPLVGERARQHDVAIEETARRVRDRLVQVVAFHEHGVEPRHVAVRRRAGALQKARQHGENRGRVAARGRRLPDREPDFPLRHRQPGEGIHHEHHVESLVAKVLGDGGGQERAADAHQRRLVGRRNDHDGARQALRPEVPVDELAHLATTLADERDDVDLRPRGPGDHAEQRALADTRAGEDAEALPAAAGEERVQGPHAEIERGADGRALERVDGRAVEGDLARAAHRLPAVERLAEPIEHPAEHPVPHADRGALACHDDAVAGLDACHLPERHQQDAILPEAHDLRADRPGAAAPLDRAQSSHRQSGARALDHEADDVGDAPAHPHRVHVAEMPCGPREVELAHVTCASAVRIAPIWLSTPRSRSPPSLSTRHPFSASASSSTSSSSLTSSSSARRVGRRSTRKR